MKNSNRSSVTHACVTLLSLFTFSFAGMASAQPSPPSSAPSDWVLCLSAWMNLNIRTLSST